MSERYKSLSEKPYESHYVYFEDVIEASVEAVWPHAVRIGDWMNDHRLETLEGSPGKVNLFERVYPHGLADDVPEPHYHLYGLAHAEEPRYLVLEVFSERGGSYGEPRQKLGFDVISLTDLGDKTQVGMLLIDVTMDDDQSADRKPLVPQEDEEQTTQDRIPRYFDTLRSLVEAAG
jgi:hypothetical protein